MTRPRCNALLFTLAVVALPARASAQGQDSWSLHPAAPPTATAPQQAPPEVAQPPPTQAAPQAWTEQRIPFPYQPPVPQLPRLRAHCPLQSLGTLLHVGIGGTTTVADLRYIALDVRGGILCSFTERSTDKGKGTELGMHLIPELGYHMLWPVSELEPHPPTVYLFSAGLGIGFGNRWFSISSVSRFLGGSSADAPVLGLRHGVMIRMLYETIALEASYQGLHLNGVWRSDLVGMFSINALVVALVMRAFR